MVNNLYETIEFNMGSLFKLAAKSLILSFLKALQISSI